MYLVSLSTTVLSQSSSVTETPAEASALFASLAGNSTSLEVRLCFKGICARLGSGSWACSASKDALRTTFISSSHSTPNEEVDPLGLLVLAHRARTEVVFDGIMYDYTNLSTPMVVAN